MARRRENDCPFCNPERDVAEWGWLLSNRYYWATPLGPVTPGHALIIPVWHSDQRPATIGMMAQLAVTFAEDQGIEEYNLIQNYGASASQTVFHPHLHLVPRVEGDGLVLPWTNQQADPEPQCDPMDDIQDHHDWDYGLGRSLGICKRCGALSSSWEE